MLYPLCDANPYSGKTASHSHIMRSRSTLARIDAAAMEDLNRFVDARGCDRIVAHLPKEMLENVYDRGFIVDAEN